MMNKKEKKLLFRFAISAIINVWTIAFFVTIVFIKSAHHIENTDLKLIYLAILWVATIFNSKQFLLHNDELRKEFEKEIDELK